MLAAQFYYFIRYNSRGICQSPQVTVDAWQYGISLWSKSVRPTAGDDREMASRTGNKCWYFYCCQSSNVVSHNWHTVFSPRFTILSSSEAQRSDNWTQKRGKRANVHSVLDSFFKVILLWMMLATIILNSSVS